MQASELRELADKLTDDNRPLTIEAQCSAATYLRACADALDAGPVAWTDGCGSAVTRAELKGREPHEFTADQDMLAYRIPLYPVAMPAIPQGWKLVPAEPTEDMLAATSWPGCAGADYLHMLAAVQTPPVAAPTLRLPEPMTDAEIDSIDNTPGLYGLSRSQHRRMARAIEAEVLRRVKEVNE